MGESEANLRNWDDVIAQERDDFISDLVEHGLRLTRDKSVGSTSDARLEDDRVEILIVDGFPYVTPVVRAREDIHQTWHQSNNGNLCLYATRDSDRQPWRDPDAFLQRIDVWFEQNAQGWPDDAPALDIEAYLNMDPDHRYVMYDDLSNYGDDYVTVRQEHHQLRVIGTGKVPKKSTKGLLSGYVADLGELTTPPKNWHDLITNLDGSERIKSAIDRGRVDLLLIGYRRGRQQGAIAVTLTRTKNQSPKPRLAFSASTSTKVMRLRSGTSAASIAKKHVYVIGAGALGSHICDELSRAGIGRLSIRDYDILHPGNITRHLVTSLVMCGAHKADAVKAVIGVRPYNRAAITLNLNSLTTPADAADVLTAADLVIDATADGAVTTMLEDAARATGRRFLTACLQNEGRTQRADIVPPYDDATPHSSITPLPPTVPEVFEAGCGEPISRTPPHAVTETAAMTVRHAIAMLTGHPLSPAGEVRTYT